MARMAVINDYEEYAEMAAIPLRLAGHEVLTMTAPLDIERLLAFRPEAISVGLFRKEAAFERPVTSFSEDVLGHKPIQELEGEPAIATIPIMLLGTGLHEYDVPTTLSYDVFLVLPRDIKLYVPRMEELANLRARRKLSDHHCPDAACGSRLAHVGTTGQDLYCGRCGMGVTLDGDRCHYLPAGASRTVTRPLSDLQPKLMDGAAHG